MVGRARLGYRFRIVVLNFDGGRERGGLQMCRVVVSSCGGACIGGPDVGSDGGSSPSAEIGSHRSGDRPRHLVVSGESQPWLVGRSVGRLVGFRKWAYNHARPSQ